MPQKSHQYIFLHWCSPKAYSMKTLFRILPFVLALCLISCGSGFRNFNKQKYTKLGHLKSDHVQEEVSDNEANPYQYHVSEQNTFQSDDVIEEESISSENIEEDEVLIIEEVEDSTNEESDNNSNTEETKNDGPTSEEIPEAKHGEKLFYFSLVWLAILITGVILAFTSLYTYGGLMVLFSLIIGYVILCYARLKLNNGKWFAKRKKIKWTRKHKILNGLALAGVIGFGIGFFPLLLFVLGALFGIYY